MTTSIVTYESTTESPFESLKKTDEAGEFWMARDLVTPMGYSAWGNLTKAVNRAKTAAENVGFDPDLHFSERKEFGTKWTPGLPPKFDYRLTRYGAYLLAMNGDPRKPEIAAAQTYFAVKTREAEIYSQPKELSRKQLALMVVEAEEEKERLQLELEVAGPKADYYDNVMTTENGINTTVIAKDYGRGAVWLNNLLKDLGVQYQSGKTWVLKYPYAERNYTVSSTYAYNEKSSNITTKWNQKGRKFIYELLASNGIFPQRNNFLELDQ